MLRDYNIIKLIVKPDNIDALVHIISKKDWSITNNHIISRQRRLLIRGTTLRHIFL